MVLAELIASVPDTAPELVNDDSGRSTLEVWDSLAHPNIIAAAAEETYSVLLKMRCPPRPSNSGQGEVTVQETAKNAPSRNWRAGYGLRQVGGPATVPALGPFPDWPGHSVCETGTIGP